MKRRYIIEVEIEGETEEAIGYVLDRVGRQLSENENVVFYQISKRVEGD